MIEQGGPEVNPVRQIPARRSACVFLVVLLAALWSGSPVQAQLDDTCTVSALNRTTRVQSGGVWVLPNVPTNSGPLRLRATCVADDGTVRAGQSEFFVIPENGIIEAPTVRFDQVEPVPARLDLSAPVSELTSPGETVQLVAVVTFPDGTTRDVTAADSGTSYGSSNPRTAEVGVDGLVTANVSGNVLISALHEGNLAVLAVSVILSGDSDGDGLPDDFEIANGLDPNNPFDVLDDADDDGLATGEEFDLGLDPADPDTDDDGLFDGEEVLAVGTDPRLFDTDGDRISDGLEVSSGSDPLDPASFNLAPILADLEVFPSSFTLVFNTAVGEASRLLQVTGTLVDGTTLDLRSSFYGTTYSSSDLAVVSFGSESGRLFAGQDGTAVVTVRNSGLTATTGVTVRTFAPTPLSFLFLPGHPNGVDVADGYAYVAAGGAGLHVVDVSDPRRPRVLANLDTPGNANDVRIQGIHAYVADGTAGLAVIDVSDPTAPFEAGRADTAGVATDLVVVEDLVFVADGGSGVAAVDVFDPAAPVVLGTVDTPGNARGIDAVDDLVLVADAQGGLLVIDAADPADLAIIGSTQLTSSGSRAADVAVRDRFAYVADGAWSLGGLRLVDLSEPTTPVVVGTTSDRFGLVGVALEDQFALTADYFFSNSVPIFDVGLRPPTFTAELDFLSFSRRDDNGNGVAVEDGVVYMAGTRWSIRDNGTWGDGGLHIGRYRELQDDLGVGPTVRLTRPGTGAEVLERRNLAVEAEASDDIEVVSVRFLVDDEVVLEDFRQPYEGTVVAPPDATTFTLSAEAVDRGGNVGRSEPLSVRVIPDDDPVATLLSPTASTRLVEGGLLDVAVAASDDLSLSHVEVFLDGAPAATLSSSPYRYVARVPVGTGTLTVEAVATDSVGQTASTGAFTFPVADDPPPTVDLIAPLDGSEVTEGARLQVVIGATDDVGVARAGVLVDGVLGPEDSTAPFEVIVDVPLGVGQLELTGRAVDGLGQEARSNPVVLTVRPDPGTTVAGTVVLDGQPVAGAQVTCQGRGGTSASDGAFSIGGVPTVEPVVGCSASYGDGAGTLYGGNSAAVPPVPAGVTQVGPIELEESLFEPDLGDNLNLADDQAVFRDLPFSFPFFGSSYDGIWINTNGNFTFTTSSPRDWTEDRSEFITGYRNLDRRNVGPAVALFWDDLEPFQSFSVAERDIFRFTGSAGDVVSAEVRASRNGSSLDPTLTLSDESGRVLAFNDDFYSLDSFISFQLPAEGTYYLEVEDYSGNGGASYFYSLTLLGGGAVAADAGGEIEPNDSFSTASPMSYGDVVSGVLRTEQSDLFRNIYVNEAFPGRVIFTWNEVAEYPGVGSNTVQAILFDDGRIQFGYQGVTSDDAIVGISPSNGAAPLEVDFSAAGTFRSTGAVAVFEEFDGPVGPDGTGEDPPGDRPFDLDGSVVVFTPNSDGGYDVSVFGGGNALAGQSAASRTAAGAVAGVAAAAATGPAVGTVEGVVLPDGSGPVAGVEVVVTSSGDSGFRATAVTDELGRFRVEGVPLGGVNAAASRFGAVTHRAAALLDEPGETLELAMRPEGGKPKK